MSTEKPNGKTQAQNPVESSASLEIHSICRVTEGDYAPRKRVHNVQRFSKKWSGKNLGNLLSQVTDLCIVELTLPTHSPQRALAWNRHLVNSSMLRRYQHSHPNFWMLGCGFNPLACHQRLRRKPSNVAPLNQTSEPNVGKFNSVGDDSVLGDVNGDKNLRLGRGDEPN